MFRLYHTGKVILEIHGIRSTFSTFTISNYQWSNGKELITRQFQHLPSPNINYVKDKLNDVVIWYDKVSGMGEVRMMQNRVIEAQDRFIIAQERRRDVGLELSRIQNKLKEIHSELDTTSRGEERYLQLITEEHAILKNEKRLVTEFALLEREERERFNILSYCVKESHEKERANAERTKYWSIIGSIVGTIIGVAGSSINNEFKMRELRKLVKESALRDKSVVGGELSIKLDNILQSLQHVSGIESLINQIEKMKVIIEEGNHKGKLFTISNDMESVIAKQQRDMKLITIAVSVMGVIIVTLLYRS